MEPIIKFAVSNLRPLAADIRDFAFHRVHGEVAISQIPDFDVGDGYPIIIDQGASEDCSGCAASENNTVFASDQASLVDYLESRGLPSDAGSRGLWAVKYGLCADVPSYRALAAAGENGDINAQLVAAMRYDNGDYYDFLFQYAKICQVMNDPTVDGADLRSAMQSLVAYGSVKRSISPFTFGTGAPTDRPAAFLADWRNWPASLDAIAARSKSPSYFAVTGTSDAFDNIVSCMWLNRQNGVKSGVVWGLYYKSSWVSPPGGVIVDDNLGPTANSIGGHAMRARGKRTIGGIPFLKVQQSWGKGFGDGGMAYFPRSVVNEMVAIFGAYTQSSLPRSTASYYLENGIMLGDSWIAQGFKVIRSLIFK